MMFGVRFIPERIFVPSLPEDDVMARFTNVERVFDDETNDLLGYMVDSPNASHSRYSNRNNEIPPANRNNCIGSFISRVNQQYVELSNMINKFVDDIQEDIVHSQSPLATMRFNFLNRNFVNISRLDFSSLVLRTFLPELNNPYSDYFYDLMFILLGFKIVDQEYVSMINQENEAYYSTNQEFKQKIIRISNYCYNNFIHPAILHRNNYYSLRLSENDRREFRLGQGSIELLFFLMNFYENIKEIREGTFNIKNLFYDFLDDYNNYVIHLGRMID